MGKYKAIIFLLCASAAINGFSQEPRLESGIYRWPKLNNEKTKNSESIRVFHGSTTDLASLDVDVMSIMPDVAAKFGLRTDPVTDEPNVQRLIIIKEGTLEITVGNQTKTVGAGSVAMEDSRAEITLKNVDTHPASVYVFKFKTREALSPERVSNSKGSFIVDWNETVFKTHERGGRRDVYDTSTALFDRFEMHVTMLKAGVSSHDPHRHAAEEIILLMDGDAEMLIGETHSPLLQWGIGFVDSQVLHGITENGNGTRQYYAFQWQVHK